MNMTKLLTRLPALLVMVCLLTLAPLRAESGNTAANLNGLEGFIEQVMNDWHVPGLAVAIVKDGQVVYAKGFGYRDVKKGLKVTPDTLFAIGSCSKAFTTTALAILVDEGKLDWDKPVRDYLPDFRLQDGYATAHLRIRDLVTHQSGLPRHDGVWYGSPLSRKELFDRLQYLESNKPLHAKYQYNNLMFMVAGVLIERISGSTWEEFIRRRILDPLGMKTSNFSVNDSQKTVDYSLPYQEQKGEVKEVPFRNIDAIGPAGSINSSVNEMTQWLLLQLGKGKINGRQIISEKSLGEVHTPQIVSGGDLKYDESFYTSYAMGWGVTSYRGHPALAHSGGIDGFTSQVRFLPKDQLGVVVLTNSTSPASSLIAANVVDRMLGLSEAPWAQRAKADAAKAKEAQAKTKAEDEAKRKKDAPLTHSLKDYTGQFEHPAYQTLTITEEGGQLKFDLHGLAGGLKHYHYDTFQLTGEATGLEGRKLTFLINQAGEIDRASIPLEPTVKEIVFTRKPKPQEKKSTLE
jgi:CubicO group peptidase (beta-lactamase class C family)